MSQIFDILTNPIVLIMLASVAFTFTGLFIGIYMSQPRRNRVIKFAPETGRATEYDVDREDTVNVLCKPVGDTPPQKFVKLSAAFNVTKKGIFLTKLQHFALWLGRYGTAYTFPLGQENVKLTLRQTVENIFGVELYKQLSADIRNRIEAAAIGVTVEFPNAMLTPIGHDGKPLPSISEDDIKRDDDAKILHALAAGIAKAMKMGFSWNMLFAVGTGIAIGVIVAIVFKLGGATTVVQQVTPTH